jgi:hypothetical protein
MLESGWLWWYSRMWHRDPRNRAHERMLAGLRPQRRKGVAPVAAPQEAPAPDRDPARV